MFSMRRIARGPFLSAGILSLLLLLTGCDGGEEGDGERASADSPTASQTAPAIDNLPVTVTAKQRSTVVIPGADPPLEITLDDITRGQVMVSLSSEQTIVLPERSMSVDDAVTFEWRDHAYELKLTELDNALIGEDFATFRIDRAGRNALSEAEKIERLIATIQGLQGAVFIRNGEEHPSADAVDHLVMKWQHAGDRIDSTEQFINDLATRSSVTGEPYRIRFQDGRTVPAGDWLHEQLDRIEGE